MYRCGSRRSDLNKSHNYNYHAYRPFFTTPVGIPTQSYRQKRKNKTTDDKLQMSRLAEIKEDRVVIHFQGQSLQSPEEQRRHQT